MLYGRWALERGAATVTEVVAMNVREGKIQAGITANAMSDGGSRCSQSQEAVRTEV